jgi:hypothetical protein
MIEKPRTAAGYGKGQVDLVRQTCLYVATRLGDQRDVVVVVGGLAASVPGVLARLHDLTMLEAQGVDVDAALAREAVAEAESWVARLPDRPRPERHE